MSSISVHGMKIIVVTGMLVVSIASAFMNPIIGASMASVAWLLLLLVLLEVKEK